MELLNLLNCSRTATSLAFTKIDLDGNVKSMHYDVFWQLVDSLTVSINIQTNSVVALCGEVDLYTPVFAVVCLNLNCTFTIVITTEELFKDSFINCVNYIVCSDQHKLNCLNDLQFETVTSFEFGYSLLKVKQAKLLSKFSTSNEFAYLISTSGTTGKRKLVFVPQSCIASNVSDFSKEFRTNNQDVILICLRFTFDPSLVDLFVGIASGTQIIFIDDVVRRCPFRLVEIISKFIVTYVTLTPSLFRGFSKTDLHKILGNKSSLRLILFGGEKSPNMKYIKEYCDKSVLTFYNLYGVTEVSSWASLYRFEIQKSDNECFETMPIAGRPISDTYLTIEDDELVICSSKRKCFIIEQTVPQICYWTSTFKTGDLVKKDIDGNLFIVGRKDSLVKINGKKVNLEVIEQRVEGAFLECKRCVCLLYTWYDFNIIIGFIEDSTPLESSTLLDFIRSEYGDIAAFKIVRVEMFNFTDHGKLDKAYLLKHFQSLNNFSNSKVLLTKLEVSNILFSMWKKFCKIEKTSAEQLKDSNFIKSGGDSIKALQMTIEIEFFFSLNFPRLYELLTNNTFKDICEYLGVEDKGSNSFTPSISKPLNSSSEITTGKNTVQNTCFRTISRLGTESFCHCSEIDCFISLDTNKNKKLRASFDLKVSWTLDLNKCIDASPLIVITQTERKCQHYCLIGSHSGRFCCVDIDSGKMVWDLNLLDRIESSACIDKTARYVYVGDYSGNFYGILFLNGIIMWKVNVKEAIKSSPVCSRNLVYFGAYDHCIYACQILKNDNTQIVWKHKVSDSSIYSTPLIAKKETLLIVATLDGTLAALDATNGETRWKTSLESPIFSSPVLCENNSFIVGSASSLIYRINILNGEIIWKFDKAGKSIFSSASLFEDKFVIGTHNNSLLCFDHFGNLKWTFNTDSPVFSTPQAYNEKIIFCDISGILHIVDRFGKELSSFKLNGEVFSSSVVTKNKIIVGCRNNMLYCLTF